MKKLALGIVVASVAGIFATSASAEACLTVTLTGTQGGPPVFQGQAGAGTMVQFGDETNNCAAISLQFDAGRGTVQRLSEAKTPAGKITAVFLTHMHSDHTEGLGDLMQIRWHFASKGPKIDLVCSEDVKSPLGHTLSCSSYAKHIGDPLIKSGEIAQRIAENKDRLPGGPSDLINVMTFKPSAEIIKVWEKGDVSVSAIGSRHVPGHASYRVDTPAGSVVIGGDAGNDKPTPPRESSTSANVEKLAMGADIIVHSTIHPVMAPDMDSGFPPPVYFRQSTASDLGALAERAGAKHLMLTHLIPPMGAKSQGPFKVPGGGLSEDDYKASVSEGGFSGNTIVGTDLVSLRLPTK